MGGVKMLVCWRREWPWWDGWKAAVKHQQVVRENEDHTVMHAVSLYGNAKWCSPWGCPYFSLEAWPTCLLQTGLYRRLLYFANLLLCSAAILKRSKRKRGVDREVTETSCKETDEQERREDGSNRQLQPSTCSKGFRGLLEVSRCPKCSDTLLMTALWGLKTGDGKEIAQLQNESLLQILVLHFSQSKYA